MTDRKRSYTTHFLLMAVLTAAALASVNFLAMEYRARLDLTADQRFTLSEGTERLLSSLADPVVVTYYVDEEPPAKRINLERDVRDKLQELAASSGGKLEYKIERISNADVATKRSELEKKNITPVMDVLATGSDASAAVRGIQGYYSSLEVRHGAAEPLVINGVVNLVDEMDEGREHRVDTLEFDITFTVLQMRSKGTKAPLKRLLKSLSEPVQVVALLSEQMPAKNPKLGLTIRDTVKELQRLGGQNVRCEEQLIPWNRLPDPQTQRFGTSTEEPTVDPNQPGRSGPNFYFAAIILIAADRAYPVMGLEDLTTVQQILDRVGEGAYELVKPRARLAMVLPPEAAPGMEGMGAPQSPYLPLMNYIRGTFGYETLELKLAEQKRVPADVACVVVFEPNRLPARELYEIDRYLAQGGNVVFLFQGWQSKIDVGQTGGMTESLILNKVNVEPHFEEWAKTVGLEFGQDLLIHKRGKLAPYRIRNNRYQELVPGSVPLAGVVDAGDVNGESVYGRGLSGMTLPFMVELKLDDAKVGAAGLTRQDVITLQDEVYRFIPENPAFPQLPLRLNLNSPAEVEASPSATPEKGIRLQRLDHAPLVATSLRGQFKSFWAGEGRTVPAWEGTPKDDMLAGKAAPELKAKPGNLVVVSSAGTLSIDYLWGYPQEEIEPLIIQRGLVFYRNMVEAAMYGEDLAGLRARTGVAPRIKGPVEPGSRVMWYALCLLGAPAVLAALAMFRLAARSRRRQEHEAAFSGGQP